MFINNYKKSLLMENWTVLLEWQNLLFCLSILLFILLIGSVCIGGGDSGDADADIDADADMDVDAHSGNLITDVDLHPHIDATDGNHIDSDLHDIHDAHGGHNHGDDMGVVWKCLSILGIGKIPLILLLSFWILFFGVIGLFFNFIIWDFKTLSVFVALGGSLFLTSSLAQAWKKFMPKPKSYVASPRDWIGMDATVKLKVGREFGYAYLQDQFGYPQNVVVVLDPSVLSEIESIDEGNQITLLRYDSKNQKFTCKLKKQENELS
jgi:hypothetical protein